MFVLRFDLRAPQPGVPPADLYAGAVEQVRGSRPLRLASLWGAVPPDVAWPYLDRAAEACAAARAQGTSQPIEQGRSAHGR